MQTKENRFETFFMVSGSANFSPNFEPRKGSIKLSKVTFGWNETDVIGSEIEMDVKNGELATIQGQVGAGKSSLLNLLLGEVKIHSGTMSINGTISYCSQEPWIFLGTIRENILFGKTFDSEKYNKGMVFEPSDDRLSGLNRPSESKFRSKNKNRKSYSCIVS